MSSETLGEEITEPSVSNFHATCRLEGPTEAVEEWVGSFRHCFQLVDILVGVPSGEMSFIAHTCWSVAYSLPEMVSTDVVTSPGIMYRVP